CGWSERSDEVEEQSPGRQLDHWVSRRNACAALAALATQHRVADQRNVVVRGDLRFTRRTMGARANHGKVARPTIDTDIQEAADQQAQQEREQCLHYASTSR